LTLAFQGILPNTKSAQFQEGKYGYSFKEIKVHSESGWKFRGQGESYKRGENGRLYSCGDVWKRDTVNGKKGSVGLHGCLNKEAHPGEVYIKQYHDYCERASCPVCYKIWLNRTTQNMAHRLKEAQEVFKYEGRLAKTRLIHTTISPSRDEAEDWMTEEGYKKSRRKAQRIAKRAGFTGGAMIPHPYRERCGDCGGTIGFKTKTCTECGSNNIVWYWSPHFHLIGFGWIHGSKEIYEKTGWIVKNHGIRNDVEGTIYYQLSHCGIKEGTHAISWFGVMSYKSIKTSPLRWENTAPVCPICGNKLRPIDYILGDPPPFDPEEGSILSSYGWNYR